MGSVGLYVLRYLFCLPFLEIDFMTTLFVERVTSLPGTLSASTMYIVRDSNDASLAEIVVTGTDVSEVRHVVKRDDLLVLPHR
jgi:hypothetical protein